MFTQNAYLYIEYCCSTIA